MKITGLAQRTISSTAVGARPSKSACQRRRSSGVSQSAFMPWLMAFRVVSFPATTSSTKKEAISSLVSTSSLPAAWMRAVVRSSRGLRRRSSAISRISAASSEPAWSAAASRFVPTGAYSGSPRPRIRLVLSKTSCVWLSGIPIISQTISSGSGAAISVTKSHSPFSITRSTMASARFSTAASIRARARGVKPRETIRRCRPWRGSSMLIIPPKNSFISLGRSRIEVAPRAEEKTSGARLASRICACRVSDQ